MRTLWVGIASSVLLLLILAIAVMECPILLLALIDKLTSWKSRQSEESSLQIKSDL